MANCLLYIDLVASKALLESLYYLRNVALGVCISTLNNKVVKSTIVDSLLEAVDDGVALSVDRAGYLQHLDAEVVVDDYLSLHCCVYLLCCVIFVCSIHSFHLLSNITARIYANSAKLMRRSTVTLPRKRHMLKQLY